MAKHRWQTYEEHDPDFVDDTDVYRFAYRGGEYHNGPLCMVCGRTGCEHCDPEMLVEECPGTARYDGRDARQESGDL